MTQLITHPGTNPSARLLVVRGVRPDVDGLWRHLAEPAEFFGVAMPDAQVFRSTVLGHVAAAESRVMSVTVTLFHAGDTTAIDVRGDAVRPVRESEVRIAGLDAPFGGPGAGDPHWQRMAARTTSRGRADHLARWLAEQGYVDAVPRSAVRGAPYLGALVFDTPTGLHGVERREPLSLLDQLVTAGLVRGVTHRPDRPTDARAAWWISPRFETHPVTSIDGSRYPAVVVPPFLEQS